MLLHGRMCGRAAIDSGHIQEEQCRPPIVQPHTMKAAARVSPQKNSLSRWPVTKTGVAQALRKLRFRQRGIARDTEGLFDSRKGRAGEEVIHHTETRARGQRPTEASLSGVGTGREIQQGVRAKRQRLGKKEEETL